MESEMVFLYTSMSINGTFKRAVDVLKRQAPGLIELRAYLGDRRVLGRHYDGIKSVSIEEIVGSEGKSEDFDRSFNPRQDRTRTRWLNIAKARLADRELPPVELIQVGDSYFVRDGHHRISVARALGENYIDAEVTQWQIEPLANGEVGRHGRDARYGVQDEGGEIQGAGCRIQSAWFRVPCAG